jgi:hypothetical protein
LVVKLLFGAKALQARSKRASSGACSNFIREVEGENYTLVGRPGLELKATLVTNSGVRGMIEAKGKLYVATSDKFYEINRYWTATNKGTISTLTSRVSMSFDGTYICMVDGLYVYTYNIDTATFTKQTDTDIISNPTHTVYSDGFHFINDSDAGTIATHESPNDPSGNWDALDFSTAEYAPDRLIAMVPNHGNILMIGEFTTEVWEYDINSSALPLKPIRSAYMEYGTVAPYSPVKYDTTVVWLARDTNGHGVAVRVTDGWELDVISTTELHVEWGSYLTIDDAFSQVWWIDGHPLWLLTFPSADKTWVYDSSTGGWSEFNRYEADIEERGRHRSNASAFFNGKVVCGDYKNGRVYEVGFNHLDDNGVTILSSAESQKIWDGGRRIFHARIEFLFERGVGLTDDANQGYDPQIRLEWSDDDGNTWYDRGWKSIGKKGEYRKRVFWNRLGSSRERIYRVSMSDPVEWILSSAELEVA